MKKYNYLYIALLFLFLGITKIQAQTNVVPICVAKANVVLHDGEATIWAKNYDAGSYAFDGSDLRFTFSDIAPSLDPNFDQDKNSSSKTFAVAANTTEFVNMYVWDTLDSYNYCVVSITFIEGGNRGMVWGQLHGGGAPPYVASTNLGLTSLEHDANYSINANGSGEYSFNSIRSGTYKFDLSNNFGYLNGVTTLDMVVIAKHILRIKEFNSDYKLLAADVSSDKIIDVLDLIHLRDIIVGHREKFIHNYRYVDRRLNLDTIENILKTNLDVFVSNDGDTVRIDFDVIKVGDVNNSAQFPGNNLISMNELGITEEDLILPENRSSNIIEQRDPTSPVIVNIPHMVVQENGSFCMPITIDNFSNVSGFQFSITWDSTILAFNKKSQIEGFNFYTNSVGNELFVLGTERSPHNNTAHFDLCFDVVGDKVGTFPIKFETKHNYRTAFYDHENLLPIDLNSGSVTIGQGCFVKKLIELGQYGEDTTVLATDLYIGEASSDILKINGENQINYSCSDIGLHSVELSIEYENGDTENCTIEVTVKDATRPIAVCEQNIEVQLDSNLNYTLKATDIDSGSSDNCTSDLNLVLIDSYHSTYAPTLTFDCNYSKDFYVTLKVIDDSGNSNICFTSVKLKYPEYSGTMVCNDQIKIGIKNHSKIQLTPDMFLEGNYDLFTCSNYFDLKVYDNSTSTNPHSDNFVDDTDVGKVYYCKVTNPSTLDNCWSKVKVVRDLSFDPVTFSFPEVTAEKSEEVCVSIRVNDFIDIGAFQFTVKWNKDILDYKKIVIPSDSPLNQASISFSDYSMGELRVLCSSDHSMTLADNAVLFDICYTVIGDEGEFSTLIFQGGLPLEVVRFDGISLGHIERSGMILIGNAGGCKKDFTVSLDATGSASINAERFYKDLSDVDSVLVDGSSVYDMTCDDLGINTIVAKVYHNDGIVEKCFVNVYVQDKIPPFLAVNSDVDVVLPSSASLELDVFDFIETAVDNCNIVKYEITPKYIDCNSSNPTIAKITLTDQSGNSFTKNSKINIDYSGTNPTVMVCNDQVDILIENNNAVEVTSDMLLEGNYDCYAAFNVTLFDMDDTELEDNIVDLYDIDKSYKARVKNKINNECWSIINIKGSGCDTPFSLDNIEWPCDAIVTTCYNINNNLSPEVLLELGVEKKCTEPTIDIDDCQLVTTSYSDQVFNLPNSIKIIREWKVYNHIKYDPSSYQNIYKYTQILIVKIDDSGDKFEICDVLPWSAPLGDCDSGHTDSDGIEWPEKNITINWYCGNLSPNFAPSYLKELDGFDERNAEPVLANNSCYFVNKSYSDIWINNNQGFERNWTILDLFSGEKYYWKQTFTINYIEEKICDTLAWDTPVGDCESGHTLDDIVEWPGDIVINTINTSLIGLRNNPEIHPNNVEPRLFSNCEADKFEVFYSDNIEIINDSLQNVQREWNIVDDYNGNIYRYTQNIVVNANINNISVCAFREDGLPIKEVKILGDEITNEGGCVDLSNLVDGTVIKPSKEADWREGLDFHDLVLLYKFVLGIEKPTNYQKIAADINNSGQITTLDAILLQKIIEGEMDIPNTPSWVFVDSKYDFPANKKLQNYPNSIVYSKDFNSYSFVGIKMGDLDNSFDLGGENSLDSTSIKIKDEILNKGEKYKVNLLTTNDYLIDGMQFALKYDQSVVRLRSITCDLLPNFTMSKHIDIKDGVIYLKYKAPNDYIKKGGVDLQSEKLLFKLGFEAISDGILSESLNFSDDDVNILIADENYKLGLTWEDKITDVVNELEGLDIRLYPQPARDFVNISISKNDYQNISYTISNIVGQIMIKDKLNENRIDISNLKNGLYLIQFYFENKKVAVKKLIIN